ncbi:uncharacterized protein [Apostichopus japonicus]|uniref:uncharacterized protein n=1 Tax=Stichopus japonicus TaxID=307972 RepID=UPI003AB55190
MEPITQPLINIQNQRYDNRLHGNQHDQHLSVCLSIVMWILGVAEWKSPIIPTRGQRHGLATFKRRLKCLSSVAFLLLVIISSVAAFAFYLFCYFGKSDHFLRFISNMCFWPSLMSVQIICLAAIIHKLIRSRRELTSFNLFDESSCTQKFSCFERPQIIPLSKLGFSICVFFFLPTLYASLKIAAFVNLRLECQYALEYLWLCSRVLSGFFFGVFCYFLYLHRVFMERQGDRAAEFIAEHTDDLDKCIEKTRAFFKEYHELRSLVLPWFSFILFTSSFGLTVFVTWNYEISQFESNGTAWHNLPGPSGTSDVGMMEQKNNTYFCVYTCDQMDWVDETSVLVAYNILVVSRHLVIAVLPFFSVKGIDLNYVWNRYRMRVMFMYSAKEREFWKNLMTFIDQLHPNSNTDLIVTIVFPLVGFASGLLSGKHF